MSEIKLPLIDWFDYKNVFTGSLGTDPKTGCLNKTTFNYSVKKRKNDDGETFLIADHYLQPSIMSGEPKSEKITFTTEATAEGIKQTEKWLSDEAHKCNF